ncbi:hypothetical protein AKJ09_10948 [Labilithrix luteola]|uniref:Type IV fimbrial biogenesis protein PilY1 n=1 Tax=Labilithrix luteola TaxID=1391654 RepID=A0A0K1QFU1_9BACT|nr:hypothetical protein [Labilithrix luteola]AKV04285.1 hypothetical protein AKJ09_10948 [Labilithrix luteola]
MTFSTLSLSRRATFALVMLGLSLAAVAAACAENQEVTTRDPDAGITTIPGVDAAEVDATDAADAGCSDDAADCGAPAPVCNAEWCPVDTKITDERIGLSAVWGSSANDVWVVGSGGTALHWDGATWATTSVGSLYSLYAVWGSGPNDVWAVSTPGALYHTTGFVDGTAQWSRVTDIADGGVDTLSLGKVARAVWGTSASDVWIGGDAFSRKGSSTLWGGFRTSAPDGGASDAGIAWTSISNNHITSIWGSGPEDIWIVGPGSRGVQYGGSSAAHTDGTLADGGVPVWTAFDTQSAYVLHAVWGSGAGDVWAVGERGSIRHFTGGATRWSIAPSPTTSTLRSVWGSSPSDVWIVGDEGTLLHYDGTTWAPATAAFEPEKTTNLYGVWGAGPNDVWAVGSRGVFHYSGPKPDAEGADR